MKEEIPKQEEFEVAEEVKEAFLTRRTWYRKLFEWMIGEITITPEKLTRKSPLMFYIDDEGEIITYKNVKPGKHFPKDKWGRKRDYYNVIEARKIMKWNYGGMKIPVYIHYQPELYGYPSEPMIDAQGVVKTVRTIQTNYKDYDEKDARMRFEDVKNWLWLVGGLLAIAIGALWLYKNFDLGGAFGASEIVVETVKTVNNATVNNPPTIIQ